MALKEEDRQKLDSVVSKMVANGESDGDIQFVISDFKSKYDKPEKSKLETAMTAMYPRLTEDAKSSKPADLGTVGKGALDILSMPGRALAATPALLPGGETFAESMSKTKSDKGGVGGFVGDVIRDPATGISLATGGLAGGAMKAAPVLSKLSPLAGKALAGLGIGAAEGAVSGITHGVERMTQGEDLGSAAKGAALETGVSALGGGVLGAIMPTKLGALDNPEVDRAIKKGIAKGIKPTVTGKKTLQGYESFFDKAGDAVKTISAYKDKINIVDDLGQKVDHPKTAAQMAQAVDQAKKIVYKEYHDMAVQAGDKGVAFDLTTVAEELAKVSDNSNKAIPPQTRTYAEKLYGEIEELDQEAPEVIESRIADLNKSLAGYYDGRVAKAQAQVDASVAKLMREQLDKQIMEATGSGYAELKKKYGALKAIEGEVNKRAVVNARKSPKGLFDMTDIFSGGELAAGLLTMNPALMAKGAASKGISEVYKAINNPENAISSMFKKTYGAVDNAAQDATKKPSIAPLKTMTAPAARAALRGLTDEQIRELSKAKK